MKHHGNLEKQNQVATRKNHVATQKNHLVTNGRVTQSSAEKGKNNWISFNNR